MYNFISSLFKGNSTSHFAKATSYLNQVSTDATDVVSNAAYAGINAAAVGGQLAIGLGAYEYIAGKIITTNAMAQTSAFVATYTAPTHLATTALNLGAKTTGFAAQTVVNHPVASLGAVEVITTLASPKFLMDAFSYAGNAIWSAGKVAFDIAAAVGEVAIGTACAASEAYEYVCPQTSKNIIDVAGFSANGYENFFND